MDEVEGGSANENRRLSRLMSRSPEYRSPRWLPPIANESPSARSAEPSCSGLHLNTPRKSRSPRAKSRSPGEKSRSRFHTGCQEKQSLYLDWSTLKTEKKTSGKQPKRTSARTAAANKEAEEREIIAYLEQNQQFLDNYIAEKVPLPVLESWLLNKIQQSQISSNAVPGTRNISRFVQNGQFCTREVLRDLLNVLSNNPTELTMMWELANYISTAIGVDAIRLYKLYPDHPSFIQCYVTDDSRLPGETTRILVRADPTQVRYVQEVAKAAACRRVSRNQDPVRFPDTPVELIQALNKKIRADHVMYQPILARNGKTIYIIEMWRVEERFRDVEEDISANFVVTGSFALHCCNSLVDTKRERTMTDFLLDVVKAMFEKMVSLDQVIKKILEFAQRLVHADRASLFLVDYRNSELVSTVFDLKFDPSQEGDIQKKEFRIPMDRGIAGYVAMTGETMNIPDAYADYRFNREIDERTGYRTVNILCMPIFVEGTVIGVVQMVNKRDNDYFDHEDEAAFQTFSPFFGLALHHARLYDRIKRNEQKYKVALEVLSYHNTCKESEVIAMLSDQRPISADLNDYYLDPFKVNELEKCKGIIVMFSELFDLSHFDLATLSRFVLTVKKNYRTVPYHNFDHGWTVAHSMYVMLRNDYKKRFDYKTRLALFVACLCHDLDHRGYTNKYMSESASPLAAMYTTSTLEHHHFNITVTILQQDGHNIFSHITSDEYKEVLGLIRHCILATDLAKFFPNLEKLNKLHAKKVPTFNWESTSHRELGMAISMTAADLSASAKPWDIQIKTVKIIFQEFYEQGDKERAAGRDPIPMMDRDKPDEQPASQVGFLSQICMPCYKLLYQILPKTKPMYLMASKNLDRWKTRAVKIERKQAKAKKEKEKQELEEKEIKKLLNQPDEAVPSTSTGNLDTFPLWQEESKPLKVVTTSDNWTQADGACAEPANVQNQESEAEELLLKPEPLKGEYANLPQWGEEPEPKTCVTRSGIWTQIDGVTWISEGGAIMCNRAFMSILEQESNAKDEIENGLEWEDREEHEEQDEE